MTNEKIYVFVLCFLVFFLLTILLAYLMWVITKTELVMIRLGQRDETIREKADKEKNKNQTWLWVNRIGSLLLALILLLSFSFAIFVRVREDAPANGIPSVKVVKSSSMSEKHPNNTYLFENDLNDQFQMYDLVICRHLPAENELKLYDIVVYKQDDLYVIHRIVGIEEPNEAHPNERYFLLRGDASETADKFPVRYEQMYGIYQGTRIPFAGSLVLFLQSPAGWLCMLLAIFAFLAQWVVEKKLKQETAKRLALIEAEENAKIFL